MRLRAQKQDSWTVTSVRLLAWLEGLAVSARRRVPLDEQLLVLLRGLVKVFGVEHEDVVALLDPFSVHLVVVGGGGGDHGGRGEGEGRDPPRSDSAPSSHGNNGDVTAADVQMQMRRSSPPAGIMVYATNALQHFTCSQRMLLLITSTQSRQIRPMSVTDFFDSRAANRSNFTRSPCPEADIHR